MELQTLPELSLQISELTHVSFFSSRDCNSVFGVEVFSKMTKAERMLYGDSHSNHAMVFTAVTLDVSKYCT